MIRGRTAAPLALTLTLLAGTASAQQGEPKLSDVMPPPAAATDQPSSVNRDERAVEVLTAAREALVEAKTVLFTVQSEINAKSGPLAAFKLGADGNVWARQEDNGTWTRTMIGQADDIGTSEQISFTVIKSGQNASWIDHENQEVIHAIGRYAKGRVYGSADLLGVDYLFAAKPFAAELGAPTLEYVGTETLDGTVCDVVRADYGERTLAKRWYLASSDGFPRRIVEELMEGAERVYDYSQVKVDAEIPDARFEIDAPNTYVVKNLPERRIAVNAPEGSEPIVSSPDDEVGQLFGSDVGDTGTPFTAQDIFGVEYNTESYAGKPLVLYFWASWLPGSNNAVEDIVKISDHLGDDGQLLSMAIRERQPENASNILLDMGRDDIPVITNGGRAGGAYNIARVPALIILDGEGKIIYRNDEYKPGETTDAVIKILDQLKD
ncbi:MAG: TlpA family protein disulfide reductase [Phycisphaerales bacterium]|nr:TlpA family protein disulfide reductase [Phycisphaerales bacterium]MCB9837366.1 TlpA family protein disulfide reductase [Phycisphaera sp.]